MRKKLFAVIMSVMMMVTFMPMMAFAADTITATAKVDSVSTPYDTVVVTASTGQTAKISVDRNFSSGLITADVTGAVTTLKGQIDGNPVTYPAAVNTAMDTALDTLSNVEYYDFAGASLVKNNGDPLPTSILRTSFTSPDFEVNTTTGEITMSSWGIRVVAPSYVNGYATMQDTNKVATVSNTTLAADWNAKVVVSGYNEKVADVQTVTLAAKLNVKSDSTYHKENDNGITASLVIGAATPLDVDSVEFYKDEVKVGNEATKFVSTGNENVYTYDGSEHKLVMPEAQGITASIKKFNPSTGKWDAVDDMSWKNATDVADEYNVELKGPDSTGTIKTVNLNYVIEVEPADIEIGFDSEGNYIKQVAYIGDVVDPYDYVVATAKDGVGLATADARNAIAADLDAIKTYIKAYYEATATVKSESEYTLSLKEKANLTAEEKAAKLVAEANYKVSPILGTITKILKVKESYKFNEIDFYGGTKTVHIKSAKALKKAKYVTIKAEALSGVAPTFKKLSGNGKIKVASNGKVTLKKGLKKGTYKVKVKATVAEGKGFYRTTAAKTYKIKVVK